MACPSPETKRSRRPRKAGHGGVASDGNTRERLLRSMVELAARVGYGGLEMPALAEHAGVGRSTFYEHFADRDECFLLAIDCCATDLAERASAAVELVDSVAAAAATIDSIVEFASADQSAARLLFVESLAGPSEGLDARDRLCDGIAAGLGRAWEERPGQPVFDLDPALLCGGLFRLMAMRLRHGETGIQESLKDDLAVWVDAYRLPRAGGKQSRKREREEGQPSEAPPISPPEALPPGRHKIPPAEVARVQRARILAAITQLSYREGYASVTVTAITEAARISRDVFYLHFLDKQDAAREANEQVFGQAIAACADAFFAAGPSWPERVWAGGSALARFVAEHPEEAHLGFVAPHAIGAPAIQHTYDRLAAFTLFMGEGYEFRPEARELPKVCSEALAAVMFELAYRELRERRNAAGLLRCLPQLAYSILAPFMGPEGAREFVTEKDDE